MNHSGRQTGWHVALLLLWTLLGASIRLMQLDSKPPWTDEFATLVFSLGHSFETIPLNQIISLETLLQPLQFDRSTPASAVVQFLMSEDVHPPLYFLLAHAWMKLFLTDGLPVSLWGARALPALLGVAAIPTLFGVSCLVWRSRFTSHITAILMAVSPFGVYLAQEARHYTLGMLWVMATLGGFVLAARSLQQRRPLAWPIGLIWIGVNAIGIASHYFFLITLGAMAIVLLVLAIPQVRTEGYSVLLKTHWRRLYLIMLGTAIGGGIWLPVWLGIRSHAITQWIQTDDRFSLLTLINPFFQSLAAWVTMLLLLPLEANNLWIAIASGTLMVLFLLWIGPKLWQGLRLQLQDPQVRFETQMLGGFVLAAIGLFFFITYGLGTDITRGARYSFVYFPAVVLLLGGILSTLWSRGLIYRWGILLVLLTSLASGLTVVNDMGYRKYYRPDVLAPVIQAQSAHSILIATTHQTLVQTGEIMGIAWAFLAKAPHLAPPQFLLAQEKLQPCIENCVATMALQTAIAQTQTPLDLWLVNFQAPVLLGDRCIPVTRPQPYASGYAYQHYLCRSVN